MECFRTTDFDNNSRLITLSAIILSGLHCIKPCLSISTLKIIYHSLFHSILSYGIMFWGNSSHSSVIFKMQKRVIRIIMGYVYRESCRALFKELKILTLSSQYIFSLLFFIVNNRDYFVSNSVYHNINTRQQQKLFTFASGVSGHVSEGSLLFRHQNFERSSQGN